MFNIRGNLCSTFAETCKNKYLCADVQLLQLRSGLSRIKVLNILWSASTEVQERSGKELYSILLFLTRPAYICADGNRFWKLSKSSYIYKSSFYFPEILMPIRWVKVNIKLTASVLYSMTISCSAGFLSEKGISFRLFYQLWVFFFLRQETCLLPPETAAVAFGFLSSLASSNDECLKCGNSRLCFIYIRDFNS